MGVRVTKSTVLTTTSQTTLRDLRDFIKACENFDDRTRVTLSYSPGHQLDPSEFMITVNDA